jgi:hypothetical protein
MFARFTAGRDEQLWYYRTLVQAFHGHPSRMAGELERVVAEIETPRPARHWFSTKSAASSQSQSTTVAAPRIRRAEP